MKPPINYMFVNNSYIYTFQSILEGGPNPLNLFNVINENPFQTDISNTLNKFSNLNLIPTVKFNIDNHYNPNTIEECFDLTTDSIVKKAILEHKENNINLFWSGGVDSTAVLASFLKSHVKFKIILHQSSIEEYPLCFNKFIKNKIPYIYYNNYNNYKENKNDINIFGTEPMSFMPCNFCKHPKYYYINDMNWKDGFCEVFFNKYADIVNDIKINSKTDYDFEFIKKNLDWFIEAYTDLIRTNKLNENMLWYQFVNITAFFLEVPEQFIDIITNNSFPYFAFDEYFYGYFYNKFKNNIFEYPTFDNNKYKIELKKYIYDYFKDDEYLKNKNNLSSMIRNIRMPRKPLILIKYANGDIKKIDNIMLRLDEIENSKEIFKIIKKIKPLVCY